MTQATMTPAVIFAVDDDARIFAEAFLHNINAKPLTGAYKMRETGENVYEESWLLPKDVFEAKVLGSPIIRDQESVLIVSGCNKQYATLRYMIDGEYACWTEDEYLGCLKEVSQREAIEAGEYTFDRGTGRYFITVDTSQSESPHERDQRELWDAIAGLLDVIDIDLNSNFSEELLDCADRLWFARDKMRPKWLDAK